MMAQDCLEADSMQRIPILEGEGDANPSFELKEPKKIVLNGDGASKNVRQFYFVKFWPYKDPDGESKILEAEKLIKDSVQEIPRIYNKIEILRAKELDCCLQLRPLYIHRSWTESGLKDQKLMLDSLQADLDNLKFSKIAQKGGANKSTARNNHSFQWWMSHGGTNLATEKRVLREMVATTQHRLSDLNQGTFPKDYFWWYSSDWSGVDKARYRKMVGKMKQIQERKEKALADSAMNPLALRSTIKEQIRLVNNILAELKLEQREIMLATEPLRKDREACEEDISVWRNQIKKILDRKDAAKKCILEVRQQLDEMNGRYQKYLSLLSNARELARKKDVKALRKLSKAQVKDFMRLWKNDSSFRMSYKFSIRSSLESRQLSTDGRIGDCDEETLRYLEGL